MTRAGVILETAAYMSSEEAKGKSADKRADTIAFWCVLCELLAGKRAFDRKSVTGTFSPHHAKKPPFPGATPLSLLFIFLLLFSGYLQAKGIELRWDPNSEPDLVGYNVYRSTAPGSGYLRLNPDPVSTPSFTDETAQLGLTYYYVATAVNQAGIESPFSNEASVQCLFPTASLLLNRMMKIRFWLPTL